MGILGSGFSFTRFRIVDPVPQNLWAEIPDRLKRFAVMDIDGIPEERSVGWTSIDDMLDTTFETSVPDKGGYIAFALRMDTRRIPPAVLKKQLTIALRDESRNAVHGGGSRCDDAPWDDSCMSTDIKSFQYHESQILKRRDMMDDADGGNRRGISRERRKELKEQVRMRLMRRFLPVPAVFDVVWNVKDGIIMLGSVRSKVAEAFSELFLRCFDIHLEPLVPYALASMRLTETDLARVDVLEPTEFVRRSGGNAR